MATPLQRHGGHDGSVATCPAAVPVHHRTPSRKWPWKRRWTFPCTHWPLPTMFSCWLPPGGHVSGGCGPTLWCGFSGRVGGWWYCPLTVWWRLDSTAGRWFIATGLSARRGFQHIALQLEDPTCVTILEWIRSDTFPPWTEVKSLCPELRFLWHHKNNLSANANGVLWRKRSSAVSQLQLLVPRPGRERLFLAYHASLIGGHLGWNHTLARLSQRFYWSGMAVGDWLRNCTTCMKRKSPAGRHHLLDNIPTGHRWDWIAMDILDVCDPTPEGFRYIIVIADYFSKWTEAFPIKDKCADTVADVLVDKIILRFWMPLVIHSDQGREFENGLMKSLCSLLGCIKTRTAPYHLESDGMVERFNRTCLMMLSMFVNDRRDKWHELLPFIMHAYHTSVHESTGYSPFRLIMGEECSLPQDVTTEELRASRESEVPPPTLSLVRCGKR